MSLSFVSGMVYRYICFGNLPLKSIHSVPFTQDRSCIRLWRYLYLNNCQYYSYCWFLYHMCQPISIIYLKNVKCCRWRSGATHKGKRRIPTIHPPTSWIQVLVFSDKINSDCSNMHILWLLQHSCVLAHPCHVFYHPLLYYHEETN